MTAGIQTADHRRRPQPEEGPLTVVYEDAWLLVADKPAGVVVHPTYKNTSGTLLNAVLWHVRHRLSGTAACGGAGAQPGILTRLDKQTSGLVVIALSAATHASMQTDAAAGRISKHYLAVVHGTPAPPRGRIVFPLARDTADRRRVVVRDEGAACETGYEVVATGRIGMSLVCCALVTGRTHQIRVHLAASGWPVVGDAVYGRPDPAIDRQALHAWRITLPHPATREPLAIESPLPGDMTRLLRRAQLASPGAR